MAPIGGKKAKKVSLGEPRALSVPVKSPGGAPPKPNHQPSGVQRRPPARLREGVPRTSPARPKEPLSPSFLPTSTALPRSLDSPLEGAPRALRLPTFPESCMHSPRRAAPDSQAGLLSLGSNVSALPQPQAAAATNAARAPLCTRDQPHRLARGGTLTVSSTRLPTVGSPGTSLLQGHICSLVGQWYVFSYSLVSAMKTKCTRRASKMGTEAVRYCGRAVIKIFKTASPAPD